MIIRRSQFDILEQQAREDFHGRAEAFLEAILAENPAGEDVAIRELVRDSERRAAAYGIASGAGIVQFACLTLAGGFPVDELSEVRSYLQGNQDLPGDEKLCALADFLADPEAEFAGQFASSGAMDEPGGDGN